MQNFIQTQLKNKPEFNLQQWLLANSSKASQISLTTHPAKFSHPDAVSTPIIFSGTREEDGFLRSGNVNLSDESLDASGNAAAIPLYKLMMSKLQDGKTVLEHLEDDTNQIRELFDLANEEEFQKVRVDLLQMKKDVGFVYTDKLLKQIYFPIGDNKYHLLSILTPSPIIYELKERVKNFPKGTRIFWLHTITYGGSKSQNISIVNSKAGGRFYLLPSLPPMIQKREVRLPTKDFISDCIRNSEVQLCFKKLHEIFKDKINNFKRRDERDALLAKITRDYSQSILECIIFASHQIRAEEKGWSVRDSYKNLPAYQKIWLDDAKDDSNIETRQNQDDWLKKLVAHIAESIILHYNKYFGRKYIILGDDEFRHIKKLLTKRKQELR